MNDGINENYITLKFFDFDFLPEILTKDLNLEPTHTALLGENRGVTILKWESNMWGYEEFIKTNDFIGDLVESFISRIITPRLKEIKVITNAHHGELSIVQYYYAGCNPGYHFSKEILSVINKTGLDIDIDTYCLSGT
jgi:hypothetical protein